MCQLDCPLKTKTKIMELPQNRRFYFEIQDSHLPQVYTCQEDNICRSIWDKIEVLLGTFWGKCWNWEPFENSLETWWEYSGNTLDKGKNEKFPPQNHYLNFFSHILSHNPHNPDQLMTCKVVTKLSSQLWGSFQWKGNVPYVITEA
jgi:hypothetical protein